MIDLSVNVPPPVIGEAALTEASLSAAERLRAMPSGGLYHQNGTQEARAVICDWLARNGVEADAETPILCNGAQQAIQLAFGDCARVSGIIASEAQTYSGAIAAAADLGLTWAPVAHDDEGMLPEELERVLRETGCRTVFTTPVCQNPLGFETGEARRGEIVETCRKHDAFIVEDDIYAIYAAKGRVTYRALAPERTYYLTSLSKCLTPLVRLGVLVPPPGRKDNLLRVMRAQSFGAPPVALELGRALIEAGEDIRAAEWLRVESRVRTGLAKDILGLAHLPMPDGSPHIWLPMPAAHNRSFAARAAEAGVLVTQPGSMAIGGEETGGVRLCLLAPHRRAALMHALNILADIKTDSRDAPLSSRSG